MGFYPKRRFHNSRRATAAAKSSPSYGMHRIENNVLLKDFVYAGNASFTVKNPATGKHFGFKIWKSRRHRNDATKPLWVNVHTDNGWIYLGSIDKQTLDFTITPKGRQYEGSLPMKAFQWVHENIKSMTLDLKALEVLHHGTCGRCGKKLLDPLSIQMGIGPECRKRNV